MTVVLRKSRDRGPQRPRAAPRSDQVPPAAGEAFRPAPEVWNSHASNVRRSIAFGTRAIRTTSVRWRLQLGLTEGKRQVSATEVEATITDT